LGIFFVISFSILILLPLDDFEEYPAFQVFNESQLVSCLPAFVIDKVFGESDFVLTVVLYDFHGRL